MVDSFPKDCLQPSLIDRLVNATEDSGVTVGSKGPEPVTSEFGATTVKPRKPKYTELTSRRLREIVRRDLEILLNTGCLSDVVDLSAFPLVAESVLNYGIPNITGGAVDNIVVSDLSKKIKKSILRYETRILPESLRVTVTTSDAMSQHALRFEIECNVWGQPAPEYLLIRTELDPESGTVSILD